jgi:hypothetical protein
MNARMRDAAYKIILYLFYQRVIWESILEKISGGALPRTKGIEGVLIDCTFFCAIAHFFVQWQARKQHRCGGERMVRLRAGAT